MSSLYFLRCIFSYSNSISSRMCWGFVGGFLFMGSNGDTNRFLKALLPNLSGWDFHGFFCWKFIFTMNGLKFWKFSRRLGIIYAEKRNSFVYNFSTHGNFLEIRIFCVFVIDDIRNHNPCSHLVTETQTESD